MASAASDRMRAYRDRLRARGLRPKQIWVYDTRDPAFRKEALRQARRVAKSDGGSDIFDWLDDVVDWTEG